MSVHLINYVDIAQILQEQALFLCVAIITRIFG